MDGTPEKDVDRDELIDLVIQLREELKKAHDRIAELEQELKKRSPDARLDDEYSLKAEEQRQNKQTGKRNKQKSPRRGRQTIHEKLDQADRIEVVCPDGFDVGQCELHRRQPVWRIEDGRAVLVAYQIYRGSGWRRPIAPGLLGRCEFGLEILVTLAFEVVIVGLSIDKTIGQVGFFWILSLGKSQADALLNRLAREWEAEFARWSASGVQCRGACRRDLVEWNINSVWSMLSETVRILIFGFHKDASTLESLWPKDVFEGVLVIDDASVYRNFSKAQKCWAHLIRKAINLTLADPDNEEYRRFLDGLQTTYREACRIKRDKRYSAAGREAKIDHLDNMLCDA